MRAKSLSLNTPHPPLSLLQGCTLVQPYFVFVFRWRLVCSPGWPHIHGVAQTVLNSQIFLHFSLLSSGYKYILPCPRHHTPFLPGLLYHFLARVSSSRLVPQSTPKKLLRIQTQSSSKRHSWSYGAKIKWCNKTYKAGQDPLPTPPTSSLIFHTRNFQQTLPHPSVMMSY